MPTSSIEKKTSFEGGRELLRDPTQTTKAPEGHRLKESKTVKPERKGRGLGVLRSELKRRDGPPSIRTERNSRHC
jgi:hypothetical protein